MSSHRLTSLLFSLCMAALPITAHAEDMSFFDPQDGSLDMSEWLLDRSGFLPVPIIITEPAVGYGGGLGLLFFSESLRDAGAKSKDVGHVVPPDIYGVAAFTTESGTKGGGAGAMISFDDDRWRYRGGIGKVDAYLDYYGVGGFLTQHNASINYTMEGWFSSQQILRRLGQSNDFLALRWIYLSLNTHFNLNTDLPLPGDREMAQTSSGIGLSYEHDSRDNIFTPNKGWQGSVDTLFYAPAWGSSNTFQTYRAHAFIYYPLMADTLVLGTRLDGRAARGSVPFYQQPFIDLRGIPMGRYQDENTAVGELELRWNITPRWAAIGFMGVGKAWGRNDNFGNAPTPVTKGVGFRYLIARRMGMYVGIDVAKGPEDNAFYIEIGNAWH